MTIFDVMQEKGQKFKFSKQGVLYLNNFEVKETEKVAKKPYCLWKIEEGKRITNKALFELNRARVSGEKEPNFELKDGVLEFVPNQKKKKANKVA